MMCADQWALGHRNPWELPHWVTYLINTFLDFVTYIGFISVDINKPYFRSQYVCVLSYYIIFKLVLIFFLLLPLCGQE